MRAIPERSCGEVHSLKALYQVYDRYLLRLCGFVTKQYNFVPA